jgi:hypothetical protein
MTAIDSKGEGQVVHSEDAVDLTRLDTVEIDNYHGLTAKTVLVYLVRPLSPQAPAPFAEYD